MTCWRGNAQRNYYGEGPVPQGVLRVRWRQSIGADRRQPQWNGVGWTGQPLAVQWPEASRRWMNFLRPPGPATEIIVGGMDSQVHFYDAETGVPSRRPLVLREANVIKGTVSVDPRGWPLLYVGNALARTRVGYRVFSLLDYRELAFLSGSYPGAMRGWPAFDSNGVVLRDRLLVPGENGLFYTARLNTSWQPETGQLRVRPEVTTARLSAAGCESSASVWGDSAYCSDNAGNLFRIDLDRPSRAVRLRGLGDDADPSITFDTDGCFYTGIEVDNRRFAGARGAVYKLRAPDGELVWKWEFPAQSFHGSTKIHDINGGLLSTPALWPDGNLVFVNTAHHPRMNMGALIALDRQTGKPRWTLKLRSYAWSSPVVVDGVVLAADASGALYVRDAATGRTLLTDAAGKPQPYFKLGATVEATPLVWEGRIYLGIRGGALLCIGGHDLPDDAPAG
jgi:outer membrane protein assembly factor BamB